MNVGDRTRERNESDMLKRAAAACRNRQRQDKDAPTAWFDWVATYLEGLAGEQTT